MRFTSKWKAWRGVRLALVAAGAAWLAWPASAALVEARSFAELSSIFDFVRTSDGAPVSRDSLVVETGGINIQVARTTPGVSVASDTGFAQIINTNPFEVAVTALVDLATFASIQLDTPLQEASASAELRIFANGEFFDAAASSIGVAAPCHEFDFPCDAVNDLESAGGTGRFVLGPEFAPNSVVVFDFEGSARAELSIIPLPAPAGLLLLGIGALGWVGRRRTCRSGISDGPPGPIPRVRNG